MSASGTTTTSKQDMIHEHLEGRERGKFFNIHFPFPRHPLFCWQENDLTDELVYFPASEQRSLVWDQAWTEGCCDLPSGVVYGWLLYSPYLGDKNKLQPTKPRSCGWQCENIWKRKGFLQYTSCVDHSKHRKKKVWLSLLKGILCVAKIMLCSPLHR